MADVAIQMKLQEYSEETFHPEIDKTSQAIIDKYRQMQSPDYLPIEEVLLADNTRVQEKIEQLRKEKIAKEQKELTFKPQLYKPPSYVTPRYRGLDLTEFEDAPEESSVQNQSQAQIGQSNNQPNESIKVEDFGNTLKQPLGQNRQQNPPSGGNKKSVHEIVGAGISTSGPVSIRGGAAQQGRSHDLPPPPPSSHGATMHFSGVANGDLVTPAYVRENRRLEQAGVGPAVFEENKENRARFDSTASTASYLLPHAQHSQSTDYGIGDASSVSPPMSISDSTQNSTFENGPAQIGPKRVSSGYSVDSTLTNTSQGPPNQNSRNQRKAAPSNSAMHGYARQMPPSSVPPIPPTGPKALPLLPHELSQQQPDSNRSDQKGYSKMSGRPGNSRPNNVDDDLSEILSLSDENSTLTSQPSLPMPQEKKMVFSRR